MKKIEVEIDGADYENVVRYFREEKSGAPIVRVPRILGGPHLPKADQPIEGDVPIEIWYVVRSRLYEADVDKILIWAEVVRAERGFQL